jgi:hypothetical protein
MPDREHVKTPELQKRARIRLENGDISAPITASSFTGALSGAPIGIHSEFKP